MAEYMGTTGNGGKWKCEQSTVTRWCRDGKIDGAEQDAKGSP